MISAHSDDEKSSPNIPHHQDQLPPSDDASLRMTPFSSTVNRKVAWSRIKTRSSQQIIREKTLKYLQIQSQFLQLVIQVESVIIATRKLKNYITIPPLFCLITDLIDRGSSIVGLFVFILLLPKKHKLIRGK